MPTSLSLQILANFDTNRVYFSFEIQLLVKLTDDLTDFGDEWLGEIWVWVRSRLIFLKLPFQVFNSSRVSYPNALFGFSFRTLFLFFYFYFFVKDDLLGFHP